MFGVLYYQESLDDADFIVGKVRGSQIEYNLEKPGLNTGGSTHGSIFRSKIGSGFEEPAGTPPPRNMRSTPPPPPRSEKGIGPRIPGLKLIALFEKPFLFDLSGGSRNRDPPYLTVGGT